MKEEDLQLAENQICSKRMTLDDKIIEMEGVQFFISCITRIEEKTSRALSDELFAKRQKGKRLHKLLLIEDASEL